MKRIKRIFQQPSKLLGFNILEVIIAIVILTVGLLGFANLQQKSMRSIQQTNNASTAANLTAEIATRITVNTAEASKGKSSTYLKSFSSINSTIDGFETGEGESSSDTAFLNDMLPIIANCYTSVGCSPKERAVADIFEWKSQIKQLLPNSQARICFDSKNTDSSLECDDVMSLQNSNIAYSIKITWDNVTGGKEVYTTQVLTYLDESVPQNQQELEPIGSIVAISGSVSSKLDASEARTVSRGNPIYAADELATGVDSNVQFKLNDGSVVYLQANTKFKINQFNFNLSQPEENINIMTLIEGGFRTLTGFIADQTPENYKVNTEVATLGVRGTYWGAVYLADAKAGSPLSVSVWEDPRPTAKSSNVVVKNDVSVFEAGSNKEFENVLVPSKQEAIEGEYYPSPQFEPVTWVEPEVDAINEIDDGITAEDVSNILEYDSYHTKANSFSAWSQKGNKKTIRSKRWFLHRKYMQHYQEALKTKGTAKYEYNIRHYQKYYREYREEMKHHGKHIRSYDEQIKRLEQQMKHYNSKNH